MAKGDAKPKDGGKGEKDGGSGFLDWITSLFTGGSDGDKNPGSSGVDAVTSAAPAPKPAAGMSVLDALQNPNTPEITSPAPVSTQGNNQGLRDQLSGASDNGPSWSPRDGGADTRSSDPNDYVGHMTDNAGNPIGGEPQQPAEPGYITDYYTTLAQEGSAAAQEAQGENAVTLEDEENPRMNRQRYQFERGAQGFAPEFQAMMNQYLGQVQGTPESFNPAEFGANLAAAFLGNSALNVAGLPANLTSNYGGGDGRHSLNWTDPTTGVSTALTNPGEADARAQAMNALGGAINIGGSVADQMLVNQQGRQQVDAVRASQDQARALGQDANTDAALGQERLNRGFTDYGASNQAADQQDQDRVSGEQAMIDANTAREVGLGDQEIEQINNAVAQAQKETGLQIFGAAVTQILPYIVAQGGDIMKSVGDFIGNFIDYAKKNGGGQGEAPTSAGAPSDPPAPQNPGGFHVPADAPQSEPAYIVDYKRDTPEFNWALYEEQQRRKQQRR